MRRIPLLQMLPVLALLVLAVAPLALGRRTLYARDVLNNHYALKTAEARLLRQGRLPLTDPYRAGGQPLVGNLNAVPLYPDNLLYLVASPLWALNAHFWLHLLLAPCAGYWLGRAWGLERSAAWAVGVCYATSGYFLSQLNLYNLVAGTALAPAFVAAVVDGWRLGPRRWAVAGGLWALLLLAGDPLLALLALTLAATAGVVRHGGRPAVPLGLALALGTLVAAPQLVELARILPFSYRGYLQYAPAAALAQSWDPRSVAEWLLPLAFGRPDFSFWGLRYYGGNPPLFYSLYPGVLAWGLLAAAGRPRSRAAWWAWGAIGAGLFLALGIWNPFVVAAQSIPGAALLRYPVKAWLLVAAGASLLCGLGFERLAERGRRRLVAVLAAATAGYGFLWILLTRLPGSTASWLQGLAPERLAGELLEAERQRWIGVTLLSLLVVALLAGSLLLARRWPDAGGALLLAVHTAGQLFFLAPLLDSDRVEPYRTAPPLLDDVPAGVSIVHGGFRDLFGRQTVAPLELFPDARELWLERSYFAELYPFAGVQWGRRYAFNPSTEGLDSFASVWLVRVLGHLPDPARLRVLAASGVDLLLLDRELAADAAGLVELRAVAPSAGHQLRLYALRRPAEAVQLVGTVLRAPNLNAGLARLTDPGFEPRRMVVLPGDGPDRVGSGGTARVVSEGIEELVVATAAREDAVLVVQRAFLPLYRATVDGREVTPRIANLHRIGIEVPGGEHRVRLWVDRRPFVAASFVAALAAGGLLAFALPRRRRDAAGPGAPR